MRRSRELFETGLAARRDYELAQIKVADLRGKVAAAEADLNRADVGIARQSEQIVRAPRDGFIQSLNAGDAATFIKAGDVLATFVPDGAQRVIEIFIDGRDVASCAPAIRRASSSRAGPRCSSPAGPRLRSGPSAAA